MRAFEKNDQAIFFGRKRDASLLRDKVFSARLTVVYGPSGVGKSSILHTLLIPYLEEEDARVIYFDNWTGANPLMTLKAALVAEAEKLQIPDPGAGAPDLSDLVPLSERRCPYLGAHPGPVRGILYPWQQPRCLA